MEDDLKTIIAGCRHIASYQEVRKAIEDSGFNITEVVCGEARGVDSLGKKYALTNSIPVKSFPANWNKYGRGAGSIRNRQMAEYAEALIAVWDGYSTGTGNMITNARSLGLKVFIYIVKDAESCNI